VKTLYLIGHRFQSTFFGCQFYICHQNGPSSPKSEEMPKGEEIAICGVLKCRVRYCLLHNHFLCILPDLTVFVMLFIRTMTCEIFSVFRKLQLVELYVNTAQSHTFQVEC
jgi:hypothetical protein